MGTFLQDLGYDQRMLTKNPGFNVVAILALALVIGANTTMSSAVSVALLRPLPYKGPARIVWVTEFIQKFSVFPVSMLGSPGILTGKTRCFRP